jgi:hypothetical protein
MLFQPKDNVAIATLVTYDNVVNKIFQTIVNPAQSV